MSRTHTASTQPKQDQPKSWRDILPIHPAADLFPMLGKDDLEALAKDIMNHGLQDKVTHYIDKDGKRWLLDGRNRYAAMEMLGMRDLLDDAEVVEDCDPVCFVISKNIHRRHLTSDQKNDLIAKLLKANPHQSNLQIAKQVKRDDKTVSKIRTQMESRSEIPNVKKRTDTKGRKQSATKKRAAGKAARSLNGKKSTAAKPDTSASALAEFKYAAKAWWPKMSKKHCEEAVAFVTGLAEKMAGTR